MSIIIPGCNDFTPETPFTVTDINNPKFTKVVTLNNLGDSLIYQYEVITTIINYFKDKVTVVFDLNGILCCPDSRRLNEKGIEALYIYKALGYSLVLWTLANEERCKNIDFLRKSLIYNLFDLVISRENYLVYDGDNPDNYILDRRKYAIFTNAVNNCKWLDDDGKKLTLQSPSDKAPQLLFESCKLIDDNSGNCGSYIKLCGGFEYQFINPEKYFKPNTPGIFEITDNVKYSLGLPIM